MIVLPAAIAAAKAAAAAATSVEFAVLFDWGSAMLSHASRAEQAADVSTALALLRVTLPDTKPLYDNDDVCDAIVAELAGGESLALDAAARAAVEARIVKLYASPACTAAGLLRHMEELAASLAPFLPDSL